MKNEEYSIIAEDIEVWAKIGVHPEEQFVENHFKVTVKVIATTPYQKGNYLDYETIVKQVELIFKAPPSVLEDLCEAIIAAIANEISNSARSIECCIKKLNPSVKGIKVGVLGVSITKQF
ncbi:MAG: dihydroneopterin aldolase [bacterium]|nr:dihydroneopterin aldolase [bacterium]